MINIIMRLFRNKYFWVVVVTVVSAVAGFVGFYADLFGKPLWPDLRCVLKLVWEYKFWSLFLLFPIGILIGYLIKVKVNKCNYIDEEKARRGVEPLIQQLEKTKKEDTRIRIAILLPLSSSENKEYVKGDVLLQLCGFSKVYYDRDNLSNEIDFRILDHKDKYEAAVKILETEFSNGTKYFITTMSKVSDKLAKFVNDTFKDKEKPILISTVTGSKTITEKLNGKNIFRFYIRVTEEVDILLQEAKSNSSVGLVIVPSDYGWTARDLFIEKWNKPPIFKGQAELSADKDCICLPKDLAGKSLKYYIEKDIKKLNGKEVILIALYGNAIYDTIKIIDELSLNPKLLLLTSTFYYNNTHSDTKDILNKYIWKSCVPKLANDSELFNEEVVKDFTYRTIDRLCKVIRDLKMKNKGKKDFRELWYEYRPRDLIINPDGNDERIELKIVQKSDYH